MLAGGGSTANLPGTIDTTSIERDNDWSLVGNYSWVVAPTKFNTLRVSHVYEKPKRGQPLYQETGDWTLAPPTLQYVNFIDQADDKLCRLPDHEGLRRSTRPSAGSCRAPEAATT